jgi:hypothetical protein
MGNRNDDELENELVDPLQVAEDERFVQQLLARYDQPHHVSPPPGLAARASLAVLRERPRSRAAFRRTIWPLQVVGFALGLLVAMGLWGVFGSSTGPASLFGGVESSLGRAFLWLTLAAKPLINVLVAIGSIGLAGCVAFMLCAWLWWRIITLQSPTALLEQRL